MKAFLVFLMVTHALACPEDFFAMTNKVQVPVDAVDKNGMTEKRFFEILDWFESHYSSIIKKEYGAELKIIADWKESTPSAFAQREGNTWIIRVLGGLSRHSLITEDAFIFVLCHEMGHHIGGAPKKKAMFGGRDWASSEGQADYYATLKCMRKIFREQDNVSVIEQIKYPKILEVECGRSFKHKNEVALCIRSNMAGLSHARLLNRQNEIHSPVSFETPDPRRVSNTFHNHPEPQCRLDTTFHGALCPIDWEAKVSETEFGPGTCVEQEYAIGPRPQCWFNPTKP